MSNPTTSFLKVSGDKIVKSDDPSETPVLLRGAGLGGWMNMENFISGYPGHEHEMRASMLKVLGEEKYEHFFDKFLEYFFTEKDAEAFANLGLNAIRLPINYRHLEDDMNPRVFKKEGLKHLDRVIDLCAKYGIYTVIDLHAAPGAQNTDWHSDLGIHKALFWDFKDFQDRTVLIWENLAEHYKNNPWVAGYNPINEPTDPKHTRLVEFYDRIEKAIRKVDDKHILFLDGNTFGADFSAFMDHPGLPNTVYACHDYSSFGFPSAPEKYVGSDEQKAKLKRSFERKIEYMKKIGGPIWNGEFGPVYADKTDGPDFEKINDVRFKVLEDQLQLYDETASSWSIWLWKDIGFQGMIYVDENTPYMKLMKPFLEKKKQLAIDAWGCDDTPVRELFEPIAAWARKAAPSFKDRYPKTWDEQRFIARLVREILVSEELCDEYASYFEGKSMDELDELAKSFHYDHCQQRTKLNDILKAHKSI